MQETASFSGLLRAYRLGANLSQNALAKRVGVNPAYVNRLESGERRPSQRHYVLNLAQALGLDEAATNSLLEAGGHLPMGYERVNARDETVRMVADLLADDSLSDDERDEFRTVVQALCRHWRPASHRPEPPQPANGRVE
ncbi:MAG TPA: helix-turn-helix transcriptional regulator [Chloroflexota bacterium]|nr:helix-turn-helix transcriptional regulator [Chloroflexota bacterium]